MHPRRLIANFTDRYPFIGPLIWMLSIQYYVTQVIVASAWQIHYSLLRNTISDLGSTACGMYDKRLVCSPLHGLMNASFIMLGITMAIGSTLIYREFRASTTNRIGFSLMSLAGLGAILVGLFPENSLRLLHFTGAFLPFLVGNIGIILLGLGLDVPKSLRNYSVISGTSALIALGLFITHNYLGLGLGGMERIVAYPQTIWLIVFGIYISKNHQHSSPKTSNHRH